MSDIEDKLTNQTYLRCREQANKFIRGMSYDDETDASALADMLFAAIRAERADIADQLYKYYYKYGCNDWKQAVRIVECPL